MRKLKAVLLLALGLLPASRWKNRLLGMFGHQVHPSAQVDPVFLIKVDRLQVGARTHIWSFSVFRDLRLADIGADITIMRWNKFWALRGFRRAGAADPDMAGVLSLGDGVLITKGHHLDCSGGFSMGEGSAIAGRDTLVYSHSYDPASHVLAAAPTRISARSFIAARTTLAMGAMLPTGSVLAMGGVLMPGATQTHMMYGGVPAKPLRNVGDWKMNEADSSDIRPKYQAKPDGASA
ncbi:hypothetical protein BH20ACT5_BH20ACT5_07750 [soil metagenome]